VDTPTFDGGERPVNGVPPLALRLRTKALGGDRSWPAPLGARPAPYHARDSARL